MPSQPNCRVRLVSSKGNEFPLDIPTATPTHFFTGGKILSFYPTINENGYTFEKDNVSDDLVKTLVSSTTDIQHCKAGYGVKDSLVPGENNTTIGAISAAVKSDDGIYIVNKIERICAKAFGYTPEDFGPDKILGKLSQECDFLMPDSEWIVVDKQDPSKILSRIAFADGLALGFPMGPNGAWAGSHVVSNGTWDYCEHDDGYVYLSVKPVSFSGVGHVAQPADPTAQITRLAAAKAMSYLPGMDDGPAAPQAMIMADVGGIQKTSDMNFLSADFHEHPDLLNADVAKQEKPFIDDGGLPDDHFAAAWSESDYSNQKDGTPQIKTRRAFPIKNPKTGELDRKKLVAAYRALIGARGDINSASQLPPNVHAHALALVRHGLNQTKPKTTKGVSSQVQTLNQLIASLSDADEATTLASIEKYLRDSQKMFSKLDMDAKDAEVNESKAQIDTLKASVAEAKEATTAAIAERDELKNKLAEIEADKLSASRYAKLNDVLPFSEEEKSATDHADFIKSLASVSAERFEIMCDKREIAKLRASVSHTTASGSRPGVNPVPSINLATPATDAAANAAVIY